MSGETSWSDRNAPIRLAQAFPQITNFGRALTFFEGQLSFRAVYTYGEPPFYALIQRQGQD